MLNNLKKSLILHFSIVILLIFFCTGCGRKGPPMPPDKEKLSEVKLPALKGGVEGSRPVNDLTRIFRA
jgi:predicted small lipoprotein YifL